MFTRPLVLARLLPALALIVSYGMIAALALITYRAHISEAVRSGPTTYQTDNGDHLPGLARRSPSITALAVVDAADLLEHPITALNVPALTVEILVDMASGSWPQTWQPTRFMGIPIGFHTWRALSFPLYCLPFWCIGGVGVEALLRRRTLRWPALLAGTLLCGFTIFIACGLIFGLDRSDRNGIAYAIIGLAFWSLLFAAYPAAWTRRPKD